MSTPVKSIFPLGFPWQIEAPFLFSVYHYAQGNEKMGPVSGLKGRNLGNDFILKAGWRMYHVQSIPGFPYLPQHGLETIAIVNKGFCDHSDSLATGVRFGEGDVQWVTAGHGIQQGTFTMNIQAEIRATMQDHQLTQFGGWPWPQADNVHERGRERFVKYPNGTLVEKDKQYGFCMN